MVLWLCGRGLCSIGSRYFLALWPLVVLCCVSAFLGSGAVGYALLVSVLWLGYGARSPLQVSVVGIHPTLSLFFIMGLWLCCLTNSLFVCVGTRPSSWWLQGFGLWGKCWGLHPFGPALRKPGRVLPVYAMQSYIFCW